MHMFPLNVVTCKHPCPLHEIIARNCRERCMSWRMCLHTIYGAIVNIAFVRTTAKSSRVSEIPDWHVRNDITEYSHTVWS